MKLILHSNIAKSRLSIISISVVQSFCRAVPLPYFAQYLLGLDNGKMNYEQRDSARFEFKMNFREICPLLQQPRLGNTCPWTPHAHYSKWNLGSCCGPQGFRRAHECHLWRKNGRWLCQATTGQARWDLVGTMGSPLALAPEAGIAGRDK